MSPYRTPAEVEQEPEYRGPRWTTWRSRTQLAILRRLAPGYLEVLRIEQRLAHLKRMTTKGVDQMQAHVHNLERLLERIEHQKQVLTQKYADRLIDQVLGDK